MEGRPHANTQLGSSSRFDTIPACDEQTDSRTHDESKYRASTASRGKNQWSRTSGPVLGLAVLRAVQEDGN